MSHSFAARFRQCLIDLDVNGMRRLHAEASPHLPQPETDDEVLCTMHLARTKMDKHLSPFLRRYSEDWLRERAKKGRVVSAVGIIVSSLSSGPKTKERVLSTQHEVSESVNQAVKDGVNLETEVPEVRQRM